MPFTLAQLTHVLRRVSTGLATQPPAAPREVFNPTALAQLEALGRPGFVDKLVCLYQRDSVLLLAELASSAEVETSLRAVHSLKSMSDQLGSPLLAELCRSGEAPMRSHDREAALTLLPAIKAAHAAFMRVLASRKGAAA